MNICRLAINPKNFRQGIATKLIKHLFQISDVRSFSVTTGLANAPALEVYKKEGFIKTGESRKDGVQLIHLIKETQWT